MDFSFLKNLFATPAKAKAVEEEASETSAPKAVQPQAPAVEDADVQDGESAMDTRIVRKPRNQRGRNGRRREVQREEQEPVSSLSPEESQALIAKLESFVQFTARSLVDAPEQVVTRVVNKDGVNVILVACAKKDTGKVIGKSGKIIAAIRVLVSGSASRAGLKATVDIDE